MMVTKNALQRQSAGEWQPPRNRQERRRARALQERQFKKRAKQYERRKKLAEAAGSVLLGIAFGLFFAWMPFFAPEPEAERRYEQARQMQIENQEMIQAINSDHMIPADEYDQYLAEREAYLQEERYWSQRELEAALEYQRQIEEAGNE